MTRKTYFQDSFRSLRRRQEARPQDSRHVCHPAALHPTHARTEEAPVAEAQAFASMEAETEGILLAIKCLTLMACLYREHWSSITESELVRFGPSQSMDLS